MALNKGSPTPWREDKKAKMSWFSPFKQHFPELDNRPGLEVADVVVLVHAGLVVATIVPASEHDSIFSKINLHPTYNFGPVYYGVMTPLTTSSGRHEGRYMNN